MHYRVYTEFFVGGGEILRANFSHFILKYNFQQFTSKRLNFYTISIVTMFYDQSYKLTIVLIIFDHYAGGGKDPMPPCMKPCTTHDYNVHVAGMFR